ncbi:MAG: cyclophilin-like fold protein [Candidatus Hodarchaeota archaeon]
MKSDKIKFITKFGEIIAELRKDYNPKTVDAILKYLPMTYKVPVQVWGEEIFFYLQDSLKTIGYENTQIELEIGDVAFWPRDPACCLFFGRTPLSKGEKPVAAEPVNVFAKIIQGMEILPKLKDGNLIWMDKIE